jgi:membrane protein involved in colicin uptake
MRINKVVAAIVGVVVLLALCAGVSFAVVTSTNNHNLAAQRAAATTSHRRAVASASAAANAKAIAAANAKAARAEADAKAAKAAASRPTSAPVAAAPPAQQAPAEGVPQQPLANAAAVVTQYYQDLSNGDYADAWTLGGVNIAGTDYNSWVAGYATTTSVTLNTESQWNSDTVSVNITATQSDGGSTSYQGTLTVENGVITSADITQAG